MRTLARLALLAGLVASLRAAEPILKITSPEKTLTFTATDFAALPRTEVTVADPHDGRERRFAGVAVQELLARLGAPLGEKLRGPALQLAVVARAKDGYAVVFALAEFDGTFTTRTIVLADREAGAPLGGKAAPLQIIVPGEKKAGRWARMVTSLEVVSLAPK